MRMHAQSSKIEAGQVYLPDQAPWLRDFETEMMQFPNGKFDDQVDSVSQFLSWVDQRRRRRMYCGTVS
jgi:predicted phage terminase large subunit-like protein